MAILCSSTVSLFVFSTSRLIAVVVYAIDCYNLLLNLKMISPHDFCHCTGCVRMYVDAEIIKSHYAGIVFYSIFT